MAPMPTQVVYYAALSLDGRIAGPDHDREVEVFAGGPGATQPQVLARAQGDASEFNDIYEEYKLAPEVTRRRLYYETMEQILSKTDKTIVESGNVTPYLPLPELKRRAEAAPPAPAQGQ